MGRSEDSSGGGKRPFQAFVRGRAQVPRKNLAGRVRGGGSLRASASVSLSFLCPPSCPVGCAEFLAAGRCGWVPGSGRGEPEGELSLCERCSLDESSGTRQDRVVVASAFCLLECAFVVGRVAQHHQELR